MSQISEFFKESHTSFGVFYPLHYIVAVFPDVTKARHANRDMVFAGFPADQAAVFEGKDFLEHEEKPAGYWNLIMQGVSHAIGAEQLSMEHHVELARKGAAFLIVHCQSNAMKDAAWSKIREAEPIAAHYYTRGYVEHLKCPYSTAH